jgi:L-ascorbate metabolism protein UlaG (beta-lactamase superfamily)
MEITWYGLSCFRLVERGSATVVTDPYDCNEIGGQPLRLPADIVTISHEAPTASSVESVTGNPYIITGPGEYEVGSVFITGIQTGGRRAGEDDQGGNPAPQTNTLYTIDYNALTVAHLGDVSRVPSQAEIEALGTVNVALVPIGSSHSLNAARIAEIISMLEPNIVIPMHYTPSARGLPLDALSKFLKEMGLSEAETLPSLKITSTSLPEETKVIVLDPQHG